MRSSISSSDIYVRARPIPQGDWLWPAVLGTMAFFALVVFLEAALATHGIHANVVDSAQRWSYERQRADDLGSRALVLVGASRVQLDIDLATLGGDTGLRPVQLGIDGNSFLPVLADLAGDDRVVGTVLVEYQDGALGGTAFDAQALDFVRAGKRERSKTVKYDFTALETVLSTWRQRYMRSYADGANPLTALTTRAFSPPATPQYLVTYPSRERYADYSKVAMPYTYYDRAARNAGITDIALKSSPSAVESALRQRIAAMAQANVPEFAQNARKIEAMVRRIEARGGEVVFVVFPRSGLVWDADNRHYPRAAFWDRFRTVTGAKGIHFMDVPSMTTFHCPDGSHLDVRDKVRFTHALARALADREWIGRSS